MQPTVLPSAHCAVRHVGAHPIKGQLSIETLLILLLFLVVLGISYTAASNIGASAQAGIRSSLAKSTFNEVSSKLSEACALGNGNVRIVEVKGEPARLSADGAELTFSAGAFSSSANSTCELLLLQNQPSKRFTIKNIGGKIEIS